MHRPPIALFLALLVILPGLLWPLACLAQEERVATILVQGLRRIDRERLLDDLKLSEGDAYSPDLEHRLERRGRRLPYLKAMRVESQAGRRGHHLTLWVREASRLRLRPFFMVLEDGDLSGGFHIDSDGLFTRRERWRGTLLAGGRAEATVKMQDLQLGPRWFGLNFDVGMRDWDHPFWSSESRSYWLLAGPSFALPGKGRLMLLGGKEWLETFPARGYESDGKDEHALYRASWRQPLGEDALQAELTTEYRAPNESDDFARASLALNAEREVGRWIFGSEFVTGRASHVSPLTGIYFLDSWRYLRAFDAGTLPAREFYFLRLRGDLRLFDMPIRMRRGGDEQAIVYSFFFLAEGAMLRETKQLDFRDASDAGLGIAMRLPGPITTRASFGLLWNSIGEARTVFMLEEI